MAGGGIGLYDGKLLQALRPFFPGLAAHDLYRFLAVFRLAVSDSKVLGFCSL